VDFIKNLLGVRRFEKRPKFENILFYQNTFKIAAKIYKIHFVFKNNCATVQNVKNAK